MSRHGFDARLGGRAALGVIYVLFAGLEGARRAAEQAAAVEELRRHARARRGSAVLVEASPAVKVIVDPWGEVGDSLALMRSVKARFDPNGVLNTGRGPGGL